MKKNSWILIYFFFISALSYAQCDNGLDIEIAERINRHDDQIQLVYAACKVWPADPQKTIIALSYEQKKQDEELEGFADYDLTLLVIDSNNHKILSQMYQKNAFTSDAIALTSLSIDTARYHLAEGVRAFGIKSSYYGASRANPFEQTILNLYIEARENIKPVLQNLVLNEGGGEWDTNCAGEFYSQSRTIHIAETTTLGYHDLMIQEKSHEMKVLVNKKGECVETSTSLPQKHVSLKFDGQSYLLPDHLKNAW